MSLRRLLLLTVALALLTVPASASAATTSSDLAVSTTPAATVPEGQNFSFTITATNNGPDDAQNVQALFTVPANSSFVSFVSITQGSATQSGSMVTASFGTIASGSSASLTMVLAAPHRGTIEAAPSVSFNPVGSQVDPDPANNAAKTDFVVTGITASAPTFASQPLGTLGPAQTVTVTNNSSQSVTFGALAPTGADAFDFLSLPNSCANATVAAGATCNLALRFAPTDLGARTAQIDLAPTSGTIDPLQFDLTGNGIPLPVNTGPQGAQGPQGVQGPPGKPAFRLVLASAVKRLLASRGSTVTLGYASTLNAHVVLDVLKGNKRVARIKGRARRGANQINWNGRQHGNAVRAGRYVLRLTATNGHQTATVRVQLTLH